MMIIASDTYGNSIEKECIVRVQYEKETSSTEQTNSSPNKSAENEEDQSVVSSDPYYVQGIMVVNKKHGLPANYAPQKNAEAGAKIRQLIADMQSQGYAISSSYSGYRSYSYQSSLYNNYVNSYGQAQADRFSARPGYSEHQTGLAFDLKHSNGTLVETTPEVNWIAAHAHEYGFIVRYPSGKESVTGYMPEPWHLRYVGDQASAIYASGLTLEEYLGVSGGGY
ncbi:M15 family metallopeptidase [Faecalicoccus pleomorphus]|nr:M15 family metallopeptidase [Faecalicoccus pleomorphus]